MMMDSTTVVNSAVKPAFHYYSTTRVEHKVEAWTSVRLGLYKSSSGYLQALRRHICRIDDVASQIIHKVRISEREVDRNLYILTVWQLTDCGRGKMVAFETIFDRIIQLGGVLVPSEAAPAMRMQYPDQPYGESIIFAMEPLVDDTDNESYVFGLDHNNGRWLSTHVYKPKRRLTPETNIVFCLPPINI